MLISRRNLLLLIPGALLNRVNGAQQNVWQRRYRASATVTLLSIPIVSKSDVGSGFVLIEEAGRRTAIQFGAGSFPENARGLNRLGFIQETVSEQNAGELAECAYFAFMTASTEKNIEQAQRALNNAGATLPYAVAEAEGKNGAFTSKLDRVSLPARVTWRDYPQLTEQVRAAVMSERMSERPDFKAVAMDLPAGESAPATFLYAVRTALMDGSARNSGRLTYNGKQYLLRTQKDPDPAMGERLAAKNLVPDAGRVMLLNAHIESCATGQVTPFKIWFESGQEHLPPLRFEYQAKSFLKLAFEFDPGASGPPVSPILDKKETV